MVAKTPERIDVTIVGPCPKRFGNESWTNERDFEVEIRIDDNEYLYRMSTCKYASGWSEPYIQGPLAVTYNSGANIFELRTMLTRLEKLFTYVSKLPIRPVTIKDWVAVTLAYHKIQTVHNMVIFPNHFDKGNYSKDETTAHVLWTVDNLVNGLVPVPVAA